MRIKIMIDSNADFSEEKAKELGFLYMSIGVQIDEEEYQDGVDLLPEQFYEKLNSCKKVPKTSLINTFRWSEAFERATADGSEVIAITISSKLSGTYQAAVEAAKDFGGKVYVVDSLNATFGEGALCLYAKQLLEEGLSAKEIVERLNVRKKDICVYAVIDTLKYLQKGGRISTATAILGTTLSIKPIIGVVDGEVKMIGKAMGYKKGCMTLNAIIEKSGTIDFSMPMGYIYSGNDRTNITNYRQNSAVLVENREIPAYVLGCSIGTHVGAGAVGLVYFKREARQ